MAIDTSTAWASVALFDGRAVLAELTWQAERRHGDEVFPMLERLLASGHVSLADVDRVAVAVGPGSFTGVRIALSVTKGLARGRRAAVAGVGTLDVVAYPHASRRVVVCALLPAGGDDFYAAFYGQGAREGRDGDRTSEALLEERDGEWRRSSPYLAETLADLATHVSEPTLFAGELDADAEAALGDLLGARALFPEPAARLRRAGYLAELGWRALEAGHATPLDKLEPIYVKPAAVRGAAVRG